MRLMRIKTGADESATRVLLRSLRSASAPASSDGVEPQGPRRWSIDGNATPNCVGSQQLPSREAEANLLSGSDLCGAVDVPVDENPDDRVSASDGVLGQEDDWFT
jgi:hypothetical protein